jgi:PAS domain S-box-containing protein
MHDPSRKNQELIDENYALKQRIKELEHSEAERQWAEEARLESENRLREITTQVPGVVYQFYVRPTGAMGFYYISDRSEPVLGLKPDLEGYFERFSAIVIPEHRDGFIKSIEKSVKEASEWKYEGMLQKPSGEIIWFSGHSSPSLRENEVVFYGIVQDISDRRRAEEELQLSEERFRLLVKNSSDIMGIVDPDGKQRYVSDAAERITGFPASELAAKNISEVIHPDDLLRVSEVFQSCLAHPDKLLRAEYRHIHKTKDWVYLEAIGQSFIDDPNIRGVITNVRDITERKHIEESLRQVEDRFATAFKNSPAWITIVHMQTHRHLEVNDAWEKLTCYTRTEAVGRTPIELGIYDKDAWGRIIEEVQAKTSVKNKEVISKSKNGAISTLLVSCERVNIEGEPYLLSMGLDITEQKKIEKKLQESERMFRSIVENSCAAIYTSDNDFLFSYVNDQLCEMSGYSREEILGMDLRRLIAEESMPIIVDRYTKRRKGEDVPSWYEFTGVRKDGEKRFLEASTAVVMDNSGQAITIGQILDITLRKQAELALRESEERFFLAFNSSPGPMSISEIETGRFIDVNEQTLRTLEFTREEMIGRTSYELGIWDDPESRIRLVKKLQGEGSFREFPVRFITKFRNTRDVLWSAEIITIGNKKVLLSMFFDISERKLAEEELRKSEKYFRAITENAADILFIVDAQGTITYCSPSVERILGYRPEELIGMSGFDLIIPEDQPRAFEDFGKASLTTEIEVPNSFRLRHKNGTVLTMEGIGKNLYHDPIIAGFVMNIRDITERKRAEEAIVASEERSRLIAENAKVVIWMMDMNLRYTYMSPYIKHNLDYTPEEYFVKPLNEVMTPSSFEFCVQLFAEELEEERKPGRDLSRSRTIEVEHIHRDGRIVPAEINITFIRDSEGNAVGILGITRDISDKKHAESVLQKSEKRYRQLIDQAADGIFVMDTNGDYLLVNKKFCEMLNYTEDELLKLNVIDTYPDELKDIGRQRIQRVISGDSLRFERPMKRKDDTLFQVEMSLSRLDDGSQQGIIHDITERKKTEEELRRLSIAIEQAAEDVIITDPEGIIQYVNPAFEKITGYSRSEAIGQNPRFLKSGVQTPSFYKNLWKTIKGGNIWTGRITNRRKDSKLIHEDATISPLLNSEGKLTGYVSLKRDITEAVRMEAQLRQAQKMEAIGTLAGGIAHDFNNILGAMMGYAELAKFKTMDVKTHPYMDQVLKACGRAKDLVQQILTFSRQREQEKKPIAVVPIVKEALKLLRSSLPATVEIRQSYTTENDTVLADPTQLHQVIMNLCTNAVHAMRESEGVLDVRLDQRLISADHQIYDPELKPGAYLQLIVSDTGEGIDPAIKDKIFDPFFTSKQPGEGTGLGLSIVYSIVRDHGGIIAMESNPGEGTTFTISLPVIDMAGQHEDQKSTVIPRGNNCILFVDDEESIASLGEEMLTALGYEVVVRLSSRDALEAFRAQPERFDVIITDMTMPHMTGASMAQEVLKIRPGFPIILTTGFSERINEEEAKKIGIRAFIMKPVSLPILAQTVKQIMDEEALTH